MRKSLRIPTLIILAAIFALAVAVAYDNAREEEPAPAPTPTPAPPTATPTPSPTPTPTSTPTPVPTATPTPTPTSTPTPVPTATPTPTPAPEPTATPTPEPVLTPQEAAAQAASAVVKLTLGENVWTGAVVSESGEILTVSGPLGNAPQVAFTLADGTEGVAWVTGRSDEQGLALLTPVGEPRAYDFLPLSGRAPGIGEHMALMQYDPDEETLSPRPVTARGFIFSLIGYGYVQLHIGENSAFDGAALINDKGELQGVRMPAAWLSRRGVGQDGEVYAASTDAIEGVLIPQLRSGYTQIAPPAPDASGPPGAPPSIPIVFLGDITVDGEPAPVGTRLYAKVSREGRDTLWFTRETVDSGEYDLPVSLNLSTYVGAVVEFWVNGKQSLTTAEIARGRNNVHSLDLVF